MATACMKLSEKLGSIDPHGATGRNGKINGSKLKIKENVAVLEVQVEKSRIPIWKPK